MRQHPNDEATGTSMKNQHLPSALRAASSGSVGGCAISAHIAVLGMLLFGSLLLSPNGVHAQAGVQIIYAPHGGNALLNGRDGILYGVFTSGGTSNLGRLFALNKDGSGYHVLRDFTGVGGDGSSPNALIDASDQLLYGTTLGGGTNSGGTVFKI